MERERRRKVSSTSKERREGKRETHRFLGFGNSLLDRLLGCIRLVVVVDRFVVFGSGGS